jgi:hypothetical protein
VITMASYWRAASFLLMGNKHFTKHGFARASKLFDNRCVAHAGTAAEQTSNPHGSSIRRTWCIHVANHLTHRLLHVSAKLVGVAGCAAVVNGALAAGCCCFAAAAWSDPLQVVFA